MRALALAAALLSAVLAAPVAAAADPHVTAPVVAATAVPASVQPAGPQVVVVGVAGLRWDQVDPAGTPALAALAVAGARGVLSVKAAGSVTCPGDGWLTLGAGARASAGDPGDRCPDGLPGPADLPELRSRNADSPEGARLGVLGHAVADAGGCAQTDGPGAELAVLGAGRDTAARDTSPPDTSGCAVLLVDGGSTADLGAADAEVAAAHAAAPQAALLVVGLSEAPGDAEPRLHLALGAGPGFEPGALVSASTRREPYVQLIDVAPTVLGLLDVPVPAEVSGQRWRSVGEQPSLDRLVGLDTKATAARASTVPFFVVLVAALLVGFAVAAVRRSARLAELVGLSGGTALAGSYLAMLVPWWRADPGLPALLAVVAVPAVLLAVLARRVPGRLGPAGAVCGLIAVVLVVDLLTGASLQVDAPAGYSPLVAGRFAGIGNVAFGIFAASALLATAAATAGRPRRTALSVCVAAGLVAVVVDGAPPFGSDVGGVLSLVPAFVLLSLLRTGARVTVVRLLVAGAAGAAVVAAFALADFTRAPQDRTHLGRLVQDLVDGTAGTLLRRKAGAVLDLLFANPVTALLPLVVAGAVLLVARPPGPLREALAAAPAWRHGLLAVGAVSAVGFVVNDSGAAIPATALLLAAPATVAVTAGTVTAARPGPPEPADR